MFDATSGQTSPGECSPEPITGDVGSGSPGTGRPNGSMRSSFPASDPGEPATAALPASPVATSSVPVGSTPIAPRLPESAPRGMPVSTGLGTSPWAMRSTAFPPAVVA